jgi:hypothetical protein
VYSHHRHSPSVRGRGRLPQGSGSLHCSSLCPGCVCGLNWFVPGRLELAYSFGNGTHFDPPPLCSRCLMRSRHLSVQNCRSWEGPYNEASTREDRGSFGWETIGNARVTIIVIVRISIRHRNGFGADPETTPALVRISVFRNAFDHKRTPRSTSSTNSSNVSADSSNPLKS